MNAKWVERGIIPSMVQINAPADKTNCITNILMCWSTDHLCCKEQTFTRCDNGLGIPSQDKKHLKQGDPSSFKMFLTLNHNNSNLFSNMVTSSKDIPSQEKDQKFYWKWLAERETRKVTRAWFVLLHQTKTQNVLKSCHRA